MASRLFRIREEADLFSRTLAEAATLGLPGYRREVKFGGIEGIASDTETELTPFGNLTRLTAASTIKVFSSTVSDTYGGAGAYNLYVGGLDGNYAEVSEVVSMAGTTTVTTTQTFLRVLRAYVQLVGNEGSNIGTIKCQATTGGTTQAQIQPGNGQTTQLFYTIPDGYVGMMGVGHYSIAEDSGGALKEVAAHIKLYYRIYNESSADNYEAWRNIDEFYIDNRGNGDYTLGVPLQTILTPRAELKFTVRGFVSGASIAGRQEGFLIDKSYL